MSEDLWMREGDDWVMRRRRNFFTLKDNDPVCFTESHRWVGELGDRKAVAEQFENLMLNYKKKTLKLTTLCLSHCYKRKYNKTASKSLTISQN